MLTKYEERDPKSGEMKVVRIVSEDMLNRGSLINVMGDNVTVLYHDDSDGKLAGQLVYEYYDLATTAKFHSCNYNTNIPNANKITKDDIVFIVDYCVPFEQFMDIATKAKMIVFLDHHKTALYDVVLRNYSFFEGLHDEGKLVMDIDMARCGAKITNDYLVGHLADSMTPWNQEVIRLIDLYDRWTKLDIKADYLNKFIFDSALSYIGSTMWDKLLYDQEYLEWAIDLGKQFYEINETRNELIYQNFAKEVEFHGIKMITIEGYGNSAMFGEHVKEYDVSCVYHITKNGTFQYSLYGNNRNIDLSAIAQTYGGGGHASASGFTVDRRLF